ncbi:putative metalloendopeptidase [Maudiozyma humilis]|uniref:Metalloendopeptidase n=1 Tax=Maudiozyma humilis TaxID=51915 RepID=A0AAV5S1I1_MAUHU|nr:putative metalloendopeptidase [Kazachstania humilis]
MGSSFEFFNLKNDETVVSPCLTIHGKCLEKASGAKNVQVQHPQLPALTFPVNAQYFKAAILLSPGENRLSFITDTNVAQTITCFYTPLTQNKPIHLCLIIAKDSPMKFDSPKTQIAKEGGNDLNLAVKKLRIAARLMQAYTNEQMVRNGFGNRVMNFVEEFAYDTQFRANETMRNTVKVHIVRSQHTLKEIRDPNVAQQNSKGNNTGALFGWAMDALRDYGGPFAPQQPPVQAACIYLDGHWDGKLILGHAALGGGDDNIKLAIFGSHGLYSWPTCMEDIVPYFLDPTKSSLQEVANDCNECSSHWECLTVTLGAFMHEIGHSLGSPHQVSGVMLRDYTRLNRSFLTQEAFSIRTNSYGAKPPIFPPEECTWHRLDMVRFLFHPAFTREYDYYDPTFYRPSKNGHFGIPKPAMYLLGNDSCKFSSQTGIYLIEVIGDDLARGHMEFLPKSLGGPGPQKEVVLSLKQLQDLLPPNEAKHRDSFNLRVLACNTPDANFDNFPSMLKTSMIPMNKYGFASGVQGIKSQLLGGSDRGSDVGIIPVDIRMVYAVRVYHGAALDGVRFYLQGGKQSAPSEKGKKETPVVPPRTYLGKLTNNFRSTPTPPSRPPSDGKSVLFGKQTNSYTNITMEPNEIITGFNVRCGAWIDAIQILTSHGRMTDMFGNKNGGGLGELIPPKGQYVLGIYGRVGQWVDAIGIVYGSL